MSGYSRAMWWAPCVLIASIAAAQTPAADPPTVQVSADATIKRLPDRAWLTVSTEVREGKAADARRKSAEAMTAVQDAIRAVGIPVDAIKTTSFSLQAEMQNGNRSVRNYVVRHQIEVRVDALDHLAEVIDAANGPKNIALTVTGPRFELKDREAVELEAMTQAVQRALGRARAMAAGADCTLGDIMRLSQGSVQVAVASPPPVPAPAPAAMRAGGRGGAADMSGGPAVVETPIVPGEIEIRATVSMTVALRPKR